MSVVSSIRTISLPALLSASIDLAQRAGVIIKTIFESGQLGAIDKAAPSISDNLNSTQSSSSTNDKELNDPQTLADLSSQRLIIGSLSSIFPSLEIIGEEGNIEVPQDDIIVPQTNLLDHLSFPDHLHHLPLSDICLWVDPLDGTKEYTLGALEGVTVLIGLTMHGKAIAGVIGQPFTGNVVYGAVGMGVYGVKKHLPKNHLTPTPVISTSTIHTNILSPSASAASIPESRRIVTTRSHYTPLLSSLITTLQPTVLLRSGGSGSKTLMLLSGTADCYYFPSPGLKYWDCVACDACIKAADGRATNAYGQELIYNKEVGQQDGYQMHQGFIATSRPEHHDYYVLPTNVPIVAKV